MVLFRLFGPNQRVSVSLSWGDVCLLEEWPVAQACLCLLCYQPSHSSIGSLDPLTDWTNKSLSEAFGAYRILFSLSLSFSYVHTNKQKCNVKNAHQGYMAYFEKINPISLSCCYFLIIFNQLSMHKNIQMCDKLIAIWWLCYAVEAILLAWFGSP